MKKIQKTFTSALAIILTAAAFSACGSEDKIPSASEKEVTTPPSVTTTVTDTETTVTSSKVSAITTSQTTTTEITTTSAGTTATTATKSPETTTTKVQTTTTKKTTTTKAQTTTTKKATTKVQTTTTNKKTTTTKPVITTTQLQEDYGKPYIGIGNTGLVNIEFEIKDYNNSKYSIIKAKVTSQDNNVEVDLTTYSDKVIIKACNETTFDLEVTFEAPNGDTKVLTTFVIITY